MNADSSLTKETNLQSTDYLQKIERFWQLGKFESFNGVGEHRIEYAYFFDEKHTSTIVISPGRCEGYLKYQEVIFDLFRKKYNVFIIDHRGQGFSQRAQQNPHKGYVEAFDFYAQDLHTFIQSIVMPKCDKLPYLLAHSLGCAIATRMMQCFPKTVNNAVLLSPMIAISSGPLPYTLAKMVIKTGNWFNNLLSPKEPWYFLGQSNYKPTCFEKNALTHSKIRYQQFVELYQRNSKIQLGGVTIHWLLEAIKSETNIFTDITKIDTPLVIIQAGDDTIVDNQKQNDFCLQLHTHSSDLSTKKPIQISRARHELLFEVNDIRDQTFQHIFDHFPHQQLTSDHDE